MGRLFLYIITSYFEHNIHNNQEILGYISMQKVLAGFEPSLKWPLQKVDECIYTDYITMNK